jgi:hypothetical protein
MSTRELLATMAATIVASGRRYPSEAVSDAREILEAIDLQEQEAERIEYMRNTNRLDPDGFDSDAEIRAALGKTHSGEF